jgi:nicotinamide riboside kinase
VKIALLGAESTGKSTLAQQLREYFERDIQTVQALESTQNICLVPEYLRTWCEQHQRTPRADEQLNIATTHQNQLLQAAAACNVLIADTTPLMVAVYSDLLFGDTSLYGMALALQRSFDTTLLMGLDLAWVADGFQRGGPHMREGVDAKVRTALTQAGIHFQVVYGSQAARVQNALKCVGSGQNRPVRLQNWACERCSDPDCEHRLFVNLLNKS